MSRPLINRANPSRIRDVVREELRKLLSAAERPASLSVAEVVRDEVQRGSQPEAPVNVPAPEEPTFTYAAITRRPPPVARQYPASSRRDTPVPQYARRQEERPQYVHQESRRQERQTSGERLTDARYATTASKVTRFVADAPTGNLSCEGSTPTTNAHAMGKRSQFIEQYLRRSSSSMPVSLRGSRSPSPRPPAYLLRRSRRERVSPLLGREN